MEKGGYQSLIKSFSKAQASKGITTLDQSTAQGSLATKSDHKILPSDSSVPDNLPTPRKSLNEILKGSPNSKPKVSNPVTPRKSVQEILKGPLNPDPRRNSGKVTSRKSVDEILSGRLVGGDGDRPFISGNKSSALSITTQNYKRSSPSGSTTRKPIADILESNSGKPSSTAGNPVEASGLHELPQDGAVQMSKAPPHPSLTRTNSRRVVFNFSASSMGRRTTQTTETHVHIRAKLLQKYLRIGESTTVPVITFKMSERDLTWKPLPAADFLRSSMSEVTQTEGLNMFIDEESQTDLLEMTTKWTQQPPQFTNLKIGTRTDPRLRKMEGLGVGQDPLPSIPELATSLSEVSQNQTTEDISLLNFVKKTSKLMLSLLRVNKFKNVPASILGGNPNEEASLLEFGRGLQPMNQLSMHTLDCQGSYVACSNVPPKERSGIGRRQEIKNIVTIWSIRDPSHPIFFLRVWGEVTAMKMAPPSGVMVCGSHNGGLNIWDLREDERIHTPFLEVYVRTPSFHTGCMEGQNHQTRIIGLEVLPETNNSTQIISMDKENVVICWSCIQTPGIETTDFSVNSAAWSRLRVRVRQVLVLSDMFKSSHLISNCLNVWEGDQKYFIIGTNNGFAGKGRIVPPEFNSHCEKFYGDTPGSLIRIHHVDVNVELNLFLASCDDKYFRIFEMSRSKAILSVECKEIPMKTLWSHQRLSVFYVAFTNRIAIWDLVASDLEPMKICPTEGLQDFQLLLCENKENMVVLTHGGMRLFMVVPQCEIAPLNENHEKLLRHYISIVH